MYMYMYMYVCICIYMHAYIHVVKSFVQSSINFAKLRAVEFCATLVQRPVQGSALAQRWLGISQHCTCIAQALNLLQPANSH